MANFLSFTISKTQQVHRDERGIAKSCPAMYCPGMNIILILTIYNLTTKTEYQAKINIMGT